MDIDILSLLKKRRSIRKYKGVKVEQEKIDQIVEAALLSPSSHANYPWRFIVVEDNNTLSKLSLSKIHGANFLSDSPLAIVVTADQNQSDVWIEDASIAATHIMLTAHSLDLGSCWVQIRKRMATNTETSEEYIKKLLNIPENINVLSIIAIGYPDEKKEPRNKSQLLYKSVFHKRFGKHYK